MKTFLNEVKLTWKWFVGKFAKKKSNVPTPLDGEVPNTPPKDISIATIAILLDGEIQEVIRAQDRMAALFLSSPEFVEIPEGLPTVPTIGWTYKNGIFENPIKLPEPPQVN